MAAPATASAASFTSRVSVTRSLIVAGSVLAAVAVWTVAVPLFGAHLLVRFGDGGTQTVGVGFVLGASLAGSALGWTVLSMMERRTSHARGLWTGTACVVLLASLILPITAATTDSSRVALALMHLAVAAVLIPGLRATGRRRWPKW